MKKVKAFSFEPSPESARGAKHSPHPGPEIYPRAFIRMDVSFFMDRQPCATQFSDEGRLAGYGSSR